jgi:L-threonylcarbamoyladenylate synthase
MISQTSLKTEILDAGAESFRRASTLIQRGELVAFPTETVYGLGADATNDKAVARVFAAKNRPEINPLIVHSHDIAAMKSWGLWSVEAEALSLAFWPGPLTLVLPRVEKSPISLLTSAGLQTIALRMPKHPVALELLRSSKCPIAAPSANLSGKISPTTPLHVMESLGGKIPLILAGGPSKIGIESTVCDLTSATPKILRAGAITKDMIERVLDQNVTYETDSEILHAPGQMKSHYAPNIAMRLNVDSADANEALLTFGPDIHIKGGKRRLALSEKGDLEEAAANLFAHLRTFDQPEFKSIAVMPIPMAGLGIAINDRLQRAAHRD